MKLTVKEAIQLLIMSIIELTMTDDIIISDGYCGVDGCNNGVGSVGNVVNLMAAVRGGRSVRFSLIKFQFSSSIFDFRKVCTIFHTKLDWFGSCE
ncbi:hypothetical protein H5410_011244 [Solanum commersonii]|uniref:Uncharacterized protein n=1 Tax=Solanum commersonii TaxID=4109 RepID=A0A9J6APD8_SOLCO|nr:hypothetical protein H5410_011244 [Solanum commersonii]